MATHEGRKFYKTKFEGVFYRLSSRRDPRTGELDRIYCFSWQDAQGKGHWKTVGRHSQGERAQTAKVARAEFLARIAGGINPARKNTVTVGDAVEAYVTWARAEGKHISQPLEQYDRHLRASLHAVPISAVTPAMLTTIKGRLESTPLARRRSDGHARLSPQSIAHLFAFARRAVNRALATGCWEGTNPFSSRQGGAWQMPRVDNRRVRFFTPAEAAGLLANLARRSRQLHDMALLSLKTGLRATEIFKLRAQDIDAHAGILHVTSKGGRIDSVPAPQDVIDMLLAYGRHGGEPIFQERGTGQPVKRISDAFRRAVDELGLDTSGGNSRYAVTFHTLRHTFASWLAQSGKVTLLELQKLMRHESLAMTQRYAHLIPGQERSKLAIIDNLLTEKH
ncbi:MAG: tyrosine-type recombinase/integrase [Desulfovibrionaceae bacterium]|nr:tyrosine-type recombinase/integrase [Desulfovibrionaceae bacterium]